MADETDVGILLSVLARLNVLEHFVRLMFRSMNSDGQISADDLMKMADRLRLQHESSMRHPESAAYQTAAVDALFNALVSDFRKDQEDRN
jgi:hypothetical protein